MNDYVDKLWNSDAVACLDALKEADDAVETINKDMFSIVAGVAADIMQENGNPSDVLKNTLKEFEKRYKGERSLKHMPGSYRSAKSTIVNAVKHGINLFDAIDGKLKGKSALEKEINQVKKQNKGEPTTNHEDKVREFGYPPEYYLTSARTLIARAETSPATGNKDDIESHLRVIEGAIASIRKQYGI